MKLSGWFCLWLLPLTLASHTWKESAPYSTAQWTSATLARTSRTTHRKGNGRVRRHTVSCGEHQFLDREANRCCNKCLPGHYKQSSCSDNTNQTRCAPCKEGSFMDQYNHVLTCHRCRSCDHAKLEEVKKSCNSTSNTVCGCKKGSYRKNDSQDFPCAKCSLCHNRTIKENCSENADTQCGDCVPGLYQDKHGECQPCRKQDCTEDNKDAPPEDWKQTFTILFSLLVFLMLGGLVTLSLRQYFTIGGGLRQAAGQSPGESKVPIHSGVSGMPGIITDSQLEHTTLLQSALPPLDRPAVPSPDVQTDKWAVAAKEEPPADAWPPAVLYAIIEEVPVRRWKEFMRVLALPDGEMERVELELAPSYRERQYQMLRLWSQRRGAELQSVHAALHSMDLPGCSQELQEKLVFLMTPKPTAPALSYPSLIQYRPEAGEASAGPAQ
ncbi:tumor necrosis factor receptor superfamily member 25 [Lepisosteus oculatus]|uniref:tumor necrosis factor receptor superfamily member 25 n=1 Tax=Lepisosteus oculatus TaxID=7918 RepID=UPI0007402FA2|nr:PREDICTED: tumor necrosis factor receptor superfamily member 25-like [Lepisosteus oculatus]